MNYKITLFFHLSYATAVISHFFNFIVSIILKNARYQNLLLILHALAHTIRANQLQWKQLHSCS